MKLERSVEGGPHELNAISYRFHIPVPPKRNTTHYYRVTTIHDRDFICSVRLICVFLFIIC